MDMVHLKKPESWQKNVEDFFHIVADIKRPGFDKFLDYLVKHTDFLKAPASTRFHASYEGGLLFHSINVHNRLLRLMTAEVNANGKSQSLSGEELDAFFESIAIVALFHDLCKALSYVVDTRNKQTGRKIPDGRGGERDEWEKVPFYAYSPQLGFGHAEKSIILMEKFFKLTEEETGAILYHMGDYRNQPDMSFVFNTNVLAVNLHLADMQATYIDESCVPEKTAQNTKDPEVLALYKAFKEKYKDIINPAPDNGGDGDASGDDNLDGVIDES